MKHRWRNCDSLVFIPFSCLNYRYADGRRIIHFFQYYSEKDDNIHANDSETWWCASFFVFNISVLLIIRNSFAGQIAFSWEIFSSSWTTLRARACNLLNKDIWISSHSLKGYVQIMKHRWKNCDSLVFISFSCLNYRYADGRRIIHSFQYYS